MLVIIDKDYPSSFEDMCENIEDVGLPSKILYGPDEAMDYLNDHGLKDHIFFNTRFYRNIFT
jgi:hypothetical protein